MVSSCSSSNKVAGKAPNNGNGAKPASNAGGMLPNKKILTMVSSCSSSNKVVGKAANNGNRAKPAISVGFENA